MNIQPLKDEFYALHAKGTEFSKAADAVKAQIRELEVLSMQAEDNGDTDKQFELYDQIEELEKEVRRLNKLSIHEFNLASAAMAAWKQAEAEQK